MEPIITGDEKDINHRFRSDFLFKKNGLKRNFVFERVNNERLVCLPTSCGLFEWTRFYYAGERSRVVRRRIYTSAEVFFYLVHSSTTLIRCVCLSLIKSVLQERFFRRTLQKSYSWIFSDSRAAHLFPTRDV